MDKHAPAGVHEHKSRATKNLRYAFVTVSTSRHEAKIRGAFIPDLSIEIARKLIQENGDTLVDYILVPDNPRLLLEAFSELISRSDVDVIVFSGGTGPSSSDITIETIKPLLQKILVGFGDVFRYLSYQEIGSPAFLSSTIAGIVSGKLVYLLPGSPNAVKLALEKLILPESGHVLSLARGDKHV
jgi:molybdenum cofactor biosynthesis protein B